MVPRTCGHCNLKYYFSSHLFSVLLAFIYPLSLHHSITVRKRLKCIKRDIQFFSFFISLTLVGHIVLATPCSCWCWAGRKNMRLISFYEGLYGFLPEPLRLPPWPGILLRSFIFEFCAGVGCLLPFALLIVCLLPRPTLLRASLMF